MTMEKTIKFTAKNEEFAVSLPFHTMPLQYVCNDGYFSTIATEKNECKGSMFPSVDACIMWTVLHILRFNNIYEDATIYITASNGTVVEIYANFDQLIEALWDTLTDVPCCENENGALELDENWFIFKKGVSVEEDVWTWFDEHYSNGVGNLMFSDAHKTSSLGYVVTKSRLENMLAMITHGFSITNMESDGETLCITLEKQNEEDIIAEFDFTHA